MVTINDTDLSKMKLIGKGTEGIVYKKDKDTLYKIYTTPISKETTIQTQLVDKMDDTDVKIRAKEDNINFNNTNPYPYYLDYSGVKKVYNAKVIDLAKERQQNIKETTLPVDSLYINGKFNGCVLKYHKNSTDLENTYYLPKKVKLNILLTLLEKVKELTDNYIYHLDLSNYNEENTIKSNILINPLTLKTNIIDLDGKSTVYSKEKNDNLYNRCYNNFSILLMEYLYNISLDPDMEEYELDELLYRLVKLSGLQEEELKQIFDLECNSYEKNKDLLLKLKYGSR